MDLSKFNPINVPNMNVDTMNQPQVAAPVVNNEPEVVMTGSLFKHLKSESAPIVLSSGTSVTASESKKKKSTRKTSSDVEVVDANGNVINGERDDISDLSNINFEETYRETTGLIRGTIAQLDVLGSELNSDLNEVRSSRTLRNKYNYVTNLSESLSSVLSTKLNAIKELNSTVKNINDMNYRKAKDVRAMEAGNDDKYLMDMYNAFISNPVGSSVPLGLNTNDITMGNNIRGIDVGIPTGGGVISTVDGAPLQKPAVNFTPEQQMMVYEQNPNIQMCVVYDKSTGNKWFQVYDISTKTPIENAPTKDPMFLEDTTIDEKRGIARNTNINETYPLILLNTEMFNGF